MSYSLPPEMLEEIGSHMEERDLTRFRSTGRELRYSQSLRERAEQLKLRREQMLKIRREQMLEIEENLVPLLSNLLSILVNGDIELFNSGDGEYLGIIRDLYLPARYPQFQILDADYYRFDELFYEFITILDTDPDFDDIVRDMYSYVYDQGALGSGSIGEEYPEDYLNEREMHDLIYALWKVIYAQE